MLRLRSKQSVRMQRRRAPRDDRAAEGDGAMAAGCKELRLCQGGHDDGAGGVLLQLQRSDLQRLVPAPQSRVSVLLKPLQHAAARPARAHVLTCGRRARPAAAARCAILLQFRATTGMRTRNAGVRRWSRDGAASRLAPGEPRPGDGAAARSALCWTT